MKILELQLLAFGPFTDRILDFREGSEGFHVIYGPNEAGKSSSLRALRQLLFGIPARSEDDFIHSYRQMRIGGILEHSDGSLVQLIRRKGRAHTLRGNDDTEVLDDAVLEKFLGTMESGVFESMFGIGYSDLVRGGQEILEGGGHVGQALFAAGSGIADLRRVQMALQTEAEALFTPSASKRKINEGLTALKQNQKALRQASLPGQAWEKHDQALRSAVQEKAQIDRKMAEVTRNKNRLERIHDALLLVARRKEVQAALDPYADALLLPESFGEAYRGFLMELKMAENDRFQANQSLEETTESMKRQNVPAVVMEHAEQIEGLYQELGSYRKAAKDRVQLLTRQEVLQSEASEILSELRDDVSLDQAWRLKLKKKETVHIRELSGLWERLVTRQESADEAFSQAESALAALEGRLKSLEEPKSVEELGTLLDRARKYGSLEESCLQEMADVAALEQVLKEKLSRQSLWPGTLESLFGLPMPSFETIDCFEKNVSEAEAEVHRCGTKIEDARNQLLDIRGKIRRLHLTQDVPTENDLQEARKRRNQGWGLVRNAWRTGVEERSAATDFAKSVGFSGSLADAYEVSVAKADGVVDRLRREADRVAEKAGLLADERMFQERRKILEASQKDALDVLEEIRREWASVWKDLGISPLSPREMRAWRQDMRAICDDANTLRSRSEKAQTLWRDIRSHRKGLGLSLARMGESEGGEVENLNDRIQRARKVIKKQEALRAKKEDLQKEQKQRKKEILTAREKVAHCRESLFKWQRDWEQALEPLCLERNTKPAEANAVLDELASLFEKVKSAKILEKRIEGIDRDAEMFHANLCLVARRVAPDFLQMAPEPLALELNTMLKRARSAKVERDSLEKEKQKYAAKLSKAEARIAQLSARLNTMCSDAGCETLDDLPLAEKRSSMRRKYSIEMDQINEQLRKLAGGLTVDAFVNEVLAEDPDGLLPRIEALSDEINELAGERSSLDQAIGSERRVLQEMDGSAAAAELAEARQQLLAGLETDIQTYVRLRLSASLLARTIEQYREKHQGPILKRTNAFFSRLTNGSFEGVRAEYDARGEAVLMGVRPGGSELVGISGMSEGTTDQLYLALRLASLEAYLEQNEPMPFIVDDILIKFDDDRSRAALKLLGELSTKTQVVFFTHHRHLVNLAQSCLDQKVLFKHELEP